MPYCLHPRLVVGAPLLAALLGWMAATPAGAVAPCSLTNVRNVCITQDSPGVTDTAEAGDGFGQVVAFGDFNGDGFRDLAIGVPGEDGNAGVVHVLYGSQTGLSTSSEQFFSQGFFSGQAAEPGDLFGSALATGDIDGDGFDDLAVGSPGETALESCGVFGDSPCNQVGVVTVVYGSATGLDFTRTESLLPTEQLPADAGANLHAGAALAIADFDGDGFGDLAVGIPGANNRTNNDGLVDVVRGGHNGLTGTVSSIGFDVVFPQMHLGTAVAAAKLVSGSDSQLVAGTPGFRNDAGGFAYCFDAFSCADLNLRSQSDFEGGSDDAGDHFGAAMAAGDFNHDGHADLAIGAPNRDHGVGFPNDSGAVYVLYGGPGWPNSTASQLLGEDEISGQSTDAGDLFGSALAAGDVDGDGFADLLVGAPGETVDGHAGAGMAVAFRGSSTGLRPSAALAEVALGGTAAAGDQLGAALAIGDVDGDGRAEVAIGAPGKNVSGHAGAGMVYVTKLFDGRFTDGFETGNTSAWSAKSP